MEQSKVKKISAGFILSWIIGVITLVSALDMFMMGIPVVGVIMVVCGVLIIPYFDKLIAQKLNFEISGGVKVVLAIVALIAYCSGIGSFISNSRNHTIDKVDENNKSLNVTTSTESPKIIAPIDCPSVVKESGKYTFKYEDSTEGEKNLWLAPAFILDMKFSDGFDLYNKPDMGNEYAYEYQYLICRVGSLTGQSVNKLYCGGSLMYKPSLRKKIIDKDGNVISTEDKEIDDFIFDIKGKDINTVNDLNSLKLESMTCK
jgi:hypothetical protein